MDVKIEPGWKQLLKDEFEKPYFHQIVLHLKTERAQGKIIYPPGPVKEVCKDNDDKGLNQKKVKVPV